MRIRLNAAADVAAVVADWLLLVIDQELLLLLLFVYDATIQSTFHTGQAALAGTLPDI